MARNGSTFVTLGSTAERVLDALTELVEAECRHEHKGKCRDDSCEQPSHTVELTNLEEVAVTIAAMIETGELA